jgi:hypothetical protein
MDGVLHVLGRGGVVPIQTDVDHEAIIVCGIHEYAPSLGAKDADS